MTNNQILKAILSINPNAEVNVGIDKDGVYDVTFHNGTAEIPKADIEAKVVELQKDYDAKQYQRDRVYPSIGEQLDMQYWDNVNGTTTWKDAVAKIKSDTPKPE